METQSKTIATGVGALGRVHLGNLFGALQPFLRECDQQKGRSFFFVVDVHTATTSVDAPPMRENIVEKVLDLLAAGLDPQRTSIYLQSTVPATFELAWLVSGMAWVRELERVPDYRERERKRPEGSPIHAAMLNYPLLMAGDILGPRANVVPVGEDQLAHLELVRDLVRRINRRYFSTGNALPVPEAPVGEPVRVPGLDGAWKMGRSRANTIALIDTPEERETKLLAAPTDPGRTETHSAGTPERCGIYALHQTATQVSVENAEQLHTISDGCRSGQLSCKECKQRLNQQLETVLLPLRARRSALALRKGLVVEVLREGARAAEPLVRETRDALHEAMGITRW